MNLPSSLKFLPLLALLTAGVAGGDVSLSFVGSSGETSRLLVKGPFARMDMLNEADGRRGFLLFHAADRSLYAVDETDRTYTAVDERTIDAQTLAMQRMIQQMRDEIRQLPPDLRAELEAQLGSGVETGPIEVIARPTDRTRTVGGVRCRDTEILASGRVRSIACVADASDLGLVPGDFQTVAELTDRLFELSKRALHAGGPIARAMGANVMPRLDGVPLEVRHPQSGAHTRLAGISTEPLNPDFFRIPPGFREKAP